ncbi:DUF2795 domain-containing protein [Spirillospora sp. NPDC029432]|uniref:DUF2795 domain-containing protein n=1 Tax=Spirillospora sp. NPDC029432 TaxID=3154599 RepID=UPI0034573252
MDQERSDKHGPKVDDELGHETKGMVQGGHSTHAQEWKEAEPTTDEPVWDPAAAAGGGREGSPPGMSAGDVDERSALARSLAGVRYPARPNELIEHLAGGEAPDSAVSALESLPDRAYENLADVAEELGYGREERRY